MNAVRKLPGEVIRTFRENYLSTKRGRLVSQEDLSGWIRYSSDKGVRRKKDETWGLETVRNIENFKKQEFSPDELDDMVYSGLLDWGDYWHAEFKQAIDFQWELKRSGKLKEEIARRVSTVGQPEPPPEAPQPETPPKRTAEQEVEQILDQEPPRAPVIEELFPEPPIPPRARGQAGPGLTLIPILATVGVILAMIGFIVLMGNQDNNRYRSPSAPTQAVAKVAVPTQAVPRVTQSSAPGAATTAKTPTLAAIWTLSPTRTPEVLKTGNPDVSITLVESTAKSVKNNISFQLLAGGKPVPEIPITYSEAEKDVTGQWSVIGTSAKLTTDGAGLAKTQLYMGDYVLEIGGDAFVGNQVRGTWGEPTSAEQPLVVPVMGNRDTEIVVSLARIEFGLIHDGQALKGVSVTVICQDRDIAGKMIVVPCNTGKATQSTDHRGLVTYTLRQGDYFLEVADLGRFEFSVKAGENRQDIRTIP